VGITNGLQPYLIPAVRAILNYRIPFIQVFDPIAERISRLGQAPGEHPLRIVWIPNCRRICSPHARCAIETPETVPTSDLPVIVLLRVTADNADESTFGPRSVEHSSIREGACGNQALRSG